MRPAPLPSPELGTTDDRTGSPPGFLAAARLLAWFEDEGGARALAVAIVEALVASPGAFVAAAPTSENPRAWLARIAGDFVARRPGESAARELAELGRLLVVVGAQLEAAGLRLEGEDVATDLGDEELEDASASYAGTVALLLGATPGLADAARAIVEADRG